MVECARVRVRMDLLGYYQSTKEWWESSGPRAHVLSLCVYLLLYVQLLIYVLLYVHWMTFARISMPTLILCSLTCLFSTFLFFFCCLSLFSFRESCGESWFIEQIGLQDMYTTEQQSLNTVPCLSAADLCLSVRNTSGMRASVRFCLLFYVFAQRYTVSTVSVLPCVQ